MNISSKYTRIPIKGKIVVDEKLGNKIVWYKRIKSITLLKKQLKHNAKQKRLRV